MTIGNFAPLVTRTTSIDNEHVQDPLIPLTSAASNKDIIQELLDAKVQSYKSEGFFPGLYETSLHATYYAIDILFSLERRAFINVDMIVDFIMEHHNISTGLFEDEYSRRYMDTYFKMSFYPLTSLLEVNCYALLTLNMLGALERIEIQDAIEFIWSCYNPETSGFIGRPHDPSLEERFRISTLDNTYYAVTALDLLMDGDWTRHSQQVSELVAFINSLQNDDGSFKNDPDDSFSTLYVAEPNPFSAFYAIKVLDLFDRVDTINLAKVRMYLTSMHHAEGDFFKISTKSGTEEYSNLIASAQCVDIADMVFFTSYDRTATIQFIINNRNDLGNWNDGTSFDYHELLYTHLIVQSLKNTGSLSLLSAQEIDEIATSMAHYHDGVGGYALISKEYTQLKALYSVVSALIEEGRYPDLTVLEREQLYTSLVDAHRETGTRNLNFYYTIGVGDGFYKFKTSPVDMYAACYKETFKNIEYTTSHKNTYLALSMLEKMLKLDDLGMTCSLHAFIDNVVGSQFLDESYDECGGFLPNDGLQTIVSYLKPMFVYFEHSYHAIKILELLTRFMGIGTVHDVGIDHEAFIAYVYRNIDQTPTTAWFQPKYTNDIEIILKNTYYAIDALQVLNAFNLDARKILNFVSENLDYSNIINVYFSYKIMNALDAGQFIDFALVKGLIPLIYDDSIHEFYESTDRKKICQEALGWITEMGCSGVIKAGISIPDSIPLGTAASISVSLTSLIYNVSTRYYLVYLESTILGNILLSVRDSSYYKELFIPFDANLYPQISGNISVYKGGIKQLQVPVTLITTYETREEFDTVLLADGRIEFTAISQLIINGECLPAGLYGFHVRLDVYKDGVYLESIQLASSETQHGDRTLYYMKYVPESFGEYYFETFYEDPISGSAKLVLKTSFNHKGASGAFQETSIAIPGAAIISIVLGLSSSGVLVFSSKKRGALHKKFNR